MFGVILRLLPFIIPAIHAVEKIVGGGKGDAKKATVLDMVMEYLQGDLAPYGVSLDSPDVAKYLGMVIDGLVGIMNLVGALKHGGAGALPPAKPGATP